MASSHIMEQRKDLAGDGEPILTKDVKITGTDQPYITPTLPGMEIVGLAFGDDVDVEIHDDHIEIWPQDDDHE